MNRDHDTDWTAAEASALRELATPVPPPAPLEQRVVDRLRNKGELPGDQAMPRAEAASPPGPTGAGRRRRTRRAMARLLPVVLPIAASIIGFVAGVWIGERRATDGGATFAAQRYMLLLYEDASYQAPRQGREAERVDEYRRWTSNVREGGGVVVVDGDELTTDEHLLQLEQGETTATGTTEPVVRVRPAAPNGPLGRVTGYFVFEATSADEALSVARTMPHLRYGGRVRVVRLAGH